MIGSGRGKVIVAFAILLAPFVGCASDGDVISPRSTGEGGVGGAAASAGTAATSGDAGRDGASGSGQAGSTSGGAARGGISAGGSSGQGGTGGEQGGTGGLGACDPSFCPNPGAGSPCCVSNDGPCGVDVGLGCSPVEGDGPS